MKTTTRMAIWFSLWLVATAMLIYKAVELSRGNLENDPSSMAWVGFLPFIAPIFAAEAACYVGPVIAIAELAIWFFRLR